MLFFRKQTKVLIVAKCNVNNAQFDPFMTAIIVLIVAKCNVNHINQFLFIFC